MEIFLGNLPYEINQQEIIDAFAQYGAVSRVKMLTDKFSGRFRGMAFVTMDNETEGKAAIDALNGKDWGGRVIKVEESRPMENRPHNNGFRPRREGGGGRFGGGGGGRFGGGGRREGGEGRGFGGDRPSFRRDSFNKGESRGDGGFRKDTRKRDFGGRERSFDDNAE